MSSRAYQPREYTATLAPWLKPVEVLDAKLGRICELFGPAAFTGAERDPESVPVVHRHNDKPVEVGHLVALERGARWIRGRFRLYDSLVGLYAAERLEHGSPVSIEFTPMPGRTLDRVGQLDVRWHIEARLDALAVGVDRSAYDALDGGARMSRSTGRIRGVTPRRPPRRRRPGHSSATSARSSKSDERRPHGTQTQTTRRHHPRRLGTHAPATPSAARAARPHRSHRLRTLRPEDRTRRTVAPRPSRQPAARLHRRQPCVLQHPSRSRQNERQPRALVTRIWSRRWIDNPDPGTVVHLGNQYADYYDGHEWRTVSTRDLALTPTRGSAF